MATIPDVHYSEIGDNFEGDLGEFSENWVQGKLDEVVDSIKGRWGSVVAARLESGALPERFYRAIVVRVAARVFRNTDGFKKENEGQYGYELNAAVASGTLWFTDDDIFDLTGVSPAQKGRRFPGTMSVGLAPPGRGFTG